MTDVTSDKSAVSSGDLLSDLVGDLSLLFSVALSETRASSISFLALLISFSMPSNFSRQGTSRPPCGKSPEYCLLPVTVQVIVPPRRRKIWQIILMKSFWVHAQLY